MTYREFLEWIAFIRIEQGDSSAQRRDGGWSQFKSGMMALVAQQEGRRGRH